MPSTDMTFRLLSFDEQRALTPQEAQDYQDWLVRQMERPHGTPPPSDYLQRDYDRRASWQHYETGV